MPEGGGTFWGTALCCPPHCLPQPQPSGLITRRAHPVVGDLLGQPRPGMQTALCACPLLSISLSRAPRADPQVPTCTGGSSATHSWLGVQEPHPHPQEQGRSHKSQDQNLAWWGLGEMVAWCVLLSFSCKFFWVVPGGFHSKWRIMSSLEVSAAIPRQQKVLFDILSPGSFIQPLSLNTSC